MRKLTKDEQSNKTCQIDGIKVRIKHTVKPDKDSPVRYELNWTFDFFNVDPKELLTLATRSVVIMQQAEWRKSDKPLDEATWDNVTFKVRDMIDGKRRTATPVQKVKRAVAKLSLEDRQAMLAQLKAELEAT